MCFNQFHIVVDNLDVNSTNSVNSRAAVSAARLLLPSEFTEVDLYAKVCSLSYTGDIRTLFAEDKNKGVPDLSEYGDVYELGFGLGHDKPPTSALVKKEFQRRIIYPLSPHEDFSDGSAEYILLYAMLLEYFNVTCYGAVADGRTESSSVSWPCHNNGSPKIEIMGTLKAPISLNDFPTP
ncbi:hypothetical protein JHK86_021843 [Glycine max]|nr:hypothetical protein JHK86_021843 [Glycine max]